MKKGKRSIDAAAVVRAIRAVLVDEHGEWRELQSCADAVETISQILDDAGLGAK